MNKPDCDPTPDSAGDSAICPSSVVAAQRNISRIALLAEATLADWHEAQAAIRRAAGQRIIYGAVGTGRTGSLEALAGQPDRVHPGAELQED